MKDISGYEGLSFWARRGPDSQAVAAMLAVIGVDSLDELAAKAVPTGIFDKLSDAGVAPGLDKLPPPASEVTNNASTAGFPASYRFRGSARCHTVGNH